MTDETAIHQLDEETVARIAAGEVVERPASAVKELVENSLDAGAETVDVTVEAGGTDLIRIADDGSGMTEADVRAAVRQHTTSKIRGLEDLESGVATLGFRGEALHTIGSVSRLSIRSRPHDSEGAGTELVYEGGTVTTVEPTGCPAGTIVEVAELFYNTPARRKFLKTTATEFAHVNRVVTRYALANPDVAVSLTHDDREVFATTGQGDLQAAVLSVYGRDVASSMIAVDASDDLPPGPLDSVSGLVSHPETNRSSREYLATYVNGRAVSADAIREGVMGAYGTQLGSDRYPFVVLFLDVPGEAVDVNVHPRKREVRFDDDDAVRRQVDAAVERALLDNGLLRSGAPRGRSAPNEARLEPGTLAGSTERPDQDGEPGVTGDRTDDAAPIDDPNTGDSAIDSTASASAPHQQPQSDAGLDADPDSHSPTDTSSTEPVADSAVGSETDRTHGPGSTANTERTSDTATGSGTTDRNRTSNAPDADRTSNAPDTDRTSDEDDGDRSRLADRADRKFDGLTEQRTLAGEPATGEESEFDTLPSMRVLGQIHDTYLVCELPDGLALIDQHAADERVNYERLREAFEADPATQALASPVALELTAIEAEAFESYKAALERLGFYADRVADRTVAVTTVPAVFAETLDPAQLRDVLASFVEGDRETGAETIDALADEFLGDLACYPSLTGNTSLTEGSVIDLLKALDDCENPYSCPHGRPVIVEIDEGEIDDRFERDYPGHGG